MATFITSKAVGQVIRPAILTSTGFWKYNHDGVDSSVFSNGRQTITVANANGEFTIISCLSDGTVSGDVTGLYLKSNQLTSFDGTGLSSLTGLELQNNQLTSFDGTGLSSLTSLYLSGNQLTSFDGTDLSSLTHLQLGGNLLTSFDGTGLSGLTYLSLTGPHGGGGSLTSVSNLPSSLSQLILENNQLTSFDGTGLSGLTSLGLGGNQLTSLVGFIFPTSLTTLGLSSNQLTSFDGTGLSGLTSLELGGNQLTSLDGFIFPTSLTGLDLSQNLLISFDETGFSGLTSLNLDYNQLTSFDGTGLSGLTYLNIEGNQLTPSINNQILNQLNQNGLSGGEFYSTGGRTSASNTDYDNLVSLGWYFEGLDLIIPPTFITSRTVGETISISVQTSTEYWKYNHNGSDSSVFGFGEQTITVANANGEFTIIPCLSDGTVSGNITQMYLNNNQLTSFDGTGLSNLTYLDLYINQLTSFDGTGLSSLTYLSLNYNQLISFDGTGLTSLNELYLNTNQITSFDGTDLSSLIDLRLNDNQLTSFDGTGLSSLINLNLGENQLTSFDGTGLSGLTELYLYNNQLTSFDGTGLSGLTNLNLDNNQLTSLVGFILPTSLTTLGLNDNQLTSFDGTGLSSLTYLEIYGNPFTPSVNNQILQQLNQNGLSGGEFYSSNGRTSASNTDYDNLVSLGWQFVGLDLPLPVTFITSKAVGDSINISVQTSTGFWKYNHDGSDSSVNVNGWINNLPVTNVNGEFTIISCDSDGNVSGDITHLHLYSNQLISFDGTGLSSLIELRLQDNQLTSFDGTGLSSLIYLEMNGNPFTPSVNNQILNQLALNGLSNGEFYSSNGRTSASNTDYDNLLNNLGWYFEGLDVVIPPTFITSTPAGESLMIDVTTSTGYWKYIFNGTESGVFPDGNAVRSGSETNNGDYTVISCDIDGNVSGEIEYLGLDNTYLTSFDGTGLSSLINLNLASNQLTSLDGFIFPTSLTNLQLQGNQLTSFDGTGLSSLTELNLNYNQLTSFDGTGLSGLTSLYLNLNPLTSFNGTDLTSLTDFILFDEKGSSSITPGLNNSILSQLNNNSVTNGMFRSSNGRTSSGTADYDSLVGKGWSLSGLDLPTPPPSGNGKLRIKGVNSGGVPTPQWDGGTIYNIGAVVTHEGQTWNCIQYAPSGYGPFGGYIDVYWTL